jgi:hypothetical protein
MKREEQELKRKLEERAEAEKVLQQSGVLFPEISKSA